MIYASYDIIPEKLREFYTLSSYSQVKRDEEGKIVYEIVTETRLDEDGEEIQVQVKKAVIETLEEYIRIHDIHPVNTDKLNMQVALGVEQEAIISTLRELDETFKAQFVDDYHKYLESKAGLEETVLEAQLEVVTEEFTQEMKDARIAEAQARVDALEEPVIRNLDEDTREFLYTLVSNIRDEKRVEGIPFEGGQQKIRDRDLISLLGVISSLQAGVVETINWYLPSLTIELDLTKAMELGALMQGRISELYATEARLGDIIRTGVLEDILAIDFRNEF